MSLNKSKNHISSEKKTFNWNKKFYEMRWKRPKVKIDWPRLPQRTQPEGKRYTSRNKYQPALYVNYQPGKKMIKKLNLRKSNYGPPK